MRAKMAALAGDWQDVLMVELILTEMGICSEPNEGACRALTASNTIAPTDARCVPVRSPTQSTLPWWMMPHRNIVAETNTVNKLLTRWFPISCYDWRN